MYIYNTACTYTKMNLHIDSEHMLKFIRNYMLTCKSVCCHEYANRYVCVDGRARACA